MVVDVWAAKELWSSVSDETGLLVSSLTTALLVWLFRLFAQPDLVSAIVVAFYNHSISFRMYYFFFKSSQNSTGVQVTFMTACDLFSCEALFTFSIMISVLPHS